MPSVQFRMQIVKTAIIALQTFGLSLIPVILKKIFEVSKAGLFDAVFPLGPDYLLTFKDILHLLLFDLEPKFHTTILKNSSMILQVDETFDFSVVLQEMTSHFFFFQKIYKDCTQVQIRNGALEAVVPQVLNPRIAVQHEFL